MPEVLIDEHKFELRKQCEIRRPSEKGYYFDVVWVKAKFAQKGNILQDGKGNHWTVHEVYGTKKMPGGRWDEFKQV